MENEDDIADWKAAGEQERAELKRAFLAITQVCKDLERQDTSHFILVKALMSVAFNQMLEHSGGGEKTADMVVSVAERLKEASKRTRVVAGVITVSTKMP